MPKSYTIRAATDKELERIKEFQDGCPDFGHRNLPDEWTADTLAERSKVLLEYIDEFGTKFYEDIAYTKGWNDYTDLSITTITRRAQPLVEYVLADPAWLGDDGSDSDCWGGLDAGKEFKFVYVGLIRLLCSVRGIQDFPTASYTDWFSHYDPTQTGFFGINGCDGDNKCHTVPNPVGRRQPDGHRVAPVVQAKRAVEITPDSIVKHMTDSMNIVEAEALVRKLMSEFSIKEQVDTNKELEQLKKKSAKQQRDLDKLRLKSREKNERIKDLEEQVEKLKKYETMIHRVWSDCYWADKVNTDVSFKDISASCEYYENEEFVKKEVVDDEDSDEETEETEETEKIEYPDRDWECLFELGGYNAMRGEMDADYKNCWKAILSKQVKTYKEWMDLEL